MIMQHVSQLSYDDEHFCEIFSFAVEQYYFYAVSKKYTKQPIVKSTKMFSLKKSVFIFVKFMKIG